MKSSAGAFVKQSSIIIILIIIAFLVFISISTVYKLDNSNLKEISGKLNSLQKKLDILQAQQDEHEQILFQRQRSQGQQTEKHQTQQQKQSVPVSPSPAFVKPPPLLVGRSNSSSSTSCIYKPQIRYEPTPWKRGKFLGFGRTPLTMLKNKEVPKVDLPDDWDGGYGWVFVKYHPSPFEARWRDESIKVEKNTTGLALCELRARSFADEELGYEKEFGRMPADDGGNEQCVDDKFPEEPMKFDDRIFSKFEYVFQCTRPPCKAQPPVSPRIGEIKFTYIEPLVGLLRHPHVCTRFTEYSWVVNKNYMIIDSWSLVNPSRSTISPEPKVLYLDGGASTWDAGAGGASQSWFHKVYSGKCLGFTDWYMYEAAPINPSLVFERLPGHIKPGYRWQNIFLKTAPEDWDNPINTLLVEAKKEDVVIFKIDFDSADVEMALLQLILDHQEVADLIDELFFEHHVNVEIMRYQWNTGGSNVFHSDSLKLFSGLRERGVRAHSWV